MPLPISQTRAPWRNLIDSHLEKAKSYDFSVATVDYDSNENPVPRVRTCGFRGFFPELELHPSGQRDLDRQVEDGGNPTLFESDMLTFTTDVRMEKLRQLESTDDNIEAMFWLKEVMVQWRIKGKAYTIGSPNPDSEREGPLRMELFEALRVKEDYRGDLSGDAGRWTWEKAVTKYFANHSPVMRGKSCRSLCGWLSFFLVLLCLVTLLSKAFFTTCRCLDLATVVSLLPLPAQLISVPLQPVFAYCLPHPANVIFRLLQKPTSWSA